MTATKKTKKARNSSKIQSGIQVAPKAPEAKGTPKTAQSKAVDKTPGTAKKEPKLATIYRVVTLPASLWVDLKKRSAAKDKATRDSIHDAIAAHLDAMVEQFSKLGLSGQVQNQKRIRLSLDADILGRLSSASAKVGLSQVELLRLVISRLLNE